MPAPRGDWLVGLASATAGMQRYAPGQLTSPAFRNAPGLPASLQKVARAEHVCCSFMKFDVTARGDEIVWEVRADARAQRVVEGVVPMPTSARAIAGHPHRAVAH